MLMITRNYLICFQRLFPEFKFTAYFFLTSSVNMLKNSLTALSSFQESFLFVLIAISFANPECLAYSHLFSVILLVLPQPSIKLFLKIFYQN